MLSDKITLAEAIRKKSLPKYKRKLDKKTIALLEVIARNLPKEGYAERFARVTGQELIDDNITHIGEDMVIPTEEYTVSKIVKVKRNHLKKLKQSWLLSDSPLHVILYGFKFIDNSFKNEWIDTVNEAFNTKYPPAYLEDQDETEDWDKS